jgi:hypothetical protein
MKTSYLRPLFFHFAGFYATIRGMKKKSPKKSELSPEVKRYLGALNEAHKDNLKGIRENFDIVFRKLDQHTEMLSQHTEMMSQHTEMIGMIMKDTTILKEDMATVKSGFRKKVDYDEFISLVKRVQRIEARF